jgi:hypothetical protein
MGPKTLRTESDGVPPTFLDSEVVFLADVGACIQQAQHLVQQVLSFSDITMAANENLKKKCYAQSMCIKGLEGQIQDLRQHLERQDATIRALRGRK